MGKFTLILLLLTGLCLKVSGQDNSGFASVTPLEPLPLSTNTSDKPQSKVWSHAGKWWAVLAVNDGTYIWRLDGTKWVKDMQVLAHKYAKADCKVVGDVVHILLYRGSSEPTLVASAQYNAASGGYEAWAERPGNVDIGYEQGGETSSMDIDSGGRMWVASDNKNKVVVRWSDPPYTSWGGPYTVATGIGTDDLCGVVALPGKVGVLWSNQVTKRFGFRTIDVGKDPNKDIFWAGDEVPASQSAKKIGQGMVDDHLNMAVASDGTLYCAVKTGYDTPGHPRLALLVRRPSGSWDNLYEVSQTGTRPIVVLNEALGRVKVIYSSVENGGDILYRESPTSNISFCETFELMKGSAHNYATSTKENYTTDIVILATDYSSGTPQLAGILATDKPLPLTGSTQGCSDEETGQKDKWFVYPNPFQDKANLSFTLLDGGVYTVTVFDAKGELVLKPRTGRAAAGESVVYEIDGKGFAIGLYLVKLQTEKGVKVFKVAR